MVSRRSLLLGLGGTVLAVGAAGTVFATTRTPHDALAPWQSPGALAADPRVKAMEWAVLAPNPHNRQPWLVKLEGDSDALVYCDLDRRLPQTDPFDRQILIGLGCFVELFVLAARQEGFDVSVLPFPDGAPPPDQRLDARPVARLTLTKGVPADPLFAAAPHRRTCKEPFDTERALRETTMNGLASASGVPLRFTLNAAQVDRLKEIAWRAWVIEADTPRTHKESVDLMRIGKAEINANPDGIDLGGPMLEALSIAGLLTRETLLDPQSTASQQGRDMYREMIDTAMGWVWLTSADNTRQAQLQAGRDWLRVNLAATQSGVSIHPMSQCLQEYPEMAGEVAAIHTELGVSGTRQIQLLARVGYGPAVMQTPRWPAATRRL